MSRARLLKPGFFLNDSLAEIQPLGRLLFQALWCLADREGRVEDRPKRLKLESLPYDDCDIDALLDDLATRGFIMRYAVAGERYIQVTKFTRHQSPHMREPASTIPASDTSFICAAAAPDEHSASTVPAPDEHHAGPAVIDPDPDPSPAAPDTPAASQSAWWGWFQIDCQREPNKAEQASMTRWLGKSPAPEEYAVHYGLQAAYLNATNRDNLCRYAITAAQHAPPPERENAGYPTAPELSPEQQAAYDAREPVVSRSAGQRNGGGGDGSRVRGLADRRAALRG